MRERASLTVVGLWTSVANVRVRVCVNGDVFEKAANFVDDDEAEAGDEREETQERMKLPHRDENIPPSFPGGGLNYVDVAALLSTNEQVQGVQASWNKLKASVAFLFWHC